MKINYTYRQIVTICQGTALQSNSTHVVENIVYDSRKISFGQNSLFLCLTTKSNDGHAFVDDAYARGIRTFLVDKTISLHTIPEATVILVNDVLMALHAWAKHHRLQYSIPLVAVTGSAGKTVVKEWLYHLLSDTFQVSRSPKSFNSQLGVALSLFEIDDKTEVAILEVGISKKGEMALLEDLIQPTLGIFTSFTSAHRENFSSEAEHLSEKLVLFKNAEKTIVSGQLVNLDFGKLTPIFSPLAAGIEQSNISLVTCAAEALHVPHEQIYEKLKTLPRIALRMESFEGIHDNTIFVDAFNLSFDGLEQALAHQLALSGTKNRYLFLSANAHQRFETNRFEQLMLRFSMAACPLALTDLLVFGSKPAQTISDIKSSTLLFKGIDSQLKKLAGQLKARKHATFVEISLSALKHNLKVWKKRVPPQVKTMAMVKASSYGVELTKVGDFLDKQNLNYLGVAYVDEGVQLRKSGITLPIMVMNSDRSSWSDCFQYRLEPSIYSFETLEDFVNELILNDLQDFPVHLKFDTGMHRLGFFERDVFKVIAFLKAQPEITVKTIYTHLADADNSSDRSYTLQQLNTFQRISETLQSQLPYPILRHALNTEGISNYPEYGFDMVRLGIGLYGITSHSKLQKELLPVLSWKSQISQIKTLQPGDTIGYGRTFRAETEIKMAVVAVGYADGFKRSLSNGRGGVYIENVFCPTLGRVCMDMIMVDITQHSFAVGTEVELIGRNMTIEKLAHMCDTIPYEIMTSLSSRMPRIFVDETD